MTVFSDIQPHRITEDAHCKPARSCYKHIDNNENSKRTGMGNLKKKKKAQNQVKQVGRALPALNTSKL